MNRHPSQDEWILFYYGEEDRGYSDHLQVCRPCLDSYHELAALLDQLEIPEAPARPDGYGRTVWDKLSGNIDALAPSEAASRLPERRKKLSDWLLPRPVWALAAGLAALLVLAFLAGRYSGVSDRPTVELASARDPKGVLLLAVGDHLDRSAVFLIELVNREAGNPLDGPSQRQFAEELLDSNRLYRQTALRDGEIPIASVLEDLERLLLEVVHTPDGSTVEQVEAIRERVESEGILFKVRVLGARVKNREQTALAKNSRRNL